ncbi:MAG: dihydroorotase [Gammaproteobacteria bacterium]|nr:dihydroorotase [Gammaproteobacteria bacterium]
MSNSITLRKPDDWHVHLRDGDMLAMALPATAENFGRAIVMPNLTPPVVTSAQASAYRERIQQLLPENSRFEPLMTCFLTDATDPDNVAKGFADGVLTAAKMYPANATTNSASGVSDVRKIYPVLERMQQIGMPLLVHGEVTDREVDIFDREKIFIDNILTKLRSDFPELRIVLEHITTADAAQFVSGAGAYTAATITPHHLMINRNAMFNAGIRPHMYCLPVAKRERHRLALRQAAISGKSCFFLGTDSAPHLRTEKESACGCAGIFSAPVALELYAQVFDEEQSLDKLEGFASIHGPKFYNKTVNEETITLVNITWQPPESIVVSGNDDVCVFGSELELNWRQEK